MMDYEIIRSRRKTLCIEIRQGQVLVRAPLRVSNAEISRFLLEKQSWIECHLAKAKAREEAKQHVPLLTDAEIRLLAGLIKREQKQVKEIIERARKDDGGPRTA